MAESSPNGNRQRLVVIYQMGKVGSSSLLESLKSHGVSPVYRVHYLTPHGLADAQRANAGAVLPHIAQSRELRAVLEDRPERFEWKIISLVREPVGRNVSALFQNLEKRLGCAPDEAFSGGPGRVRELAQRFLNEYNHDIPLSWFDNEMKATFGIDVYAQEFPITRGYTIIAGSRADLLLLRLEDLDRCANNAVEKFLGIRDFSLSRANTGASKNYAGVYRQVKKNLVLPQDYLDRMYGSKYARHFYTSQERATFRLDYTIEGMDGDDDRMRVSAPPRPDAVREDTGPDAGGESGSETPVAPPPCGTAAPHGGTAKELFVYLDPGFLNELGHYENYARALREEACRRGLEMLHFVNREASADVLTEFGAERMFVYLACIDDHPAHRRDAETALVAFAAKLHAILRRVVERGYGNARITMFMYTAHPLYFSVVAEALNDPAFKDLDIRAYLSLFYVNNRFCLNIDCPDYVKDLHAISTQLERFDPGHKVVLCCDSPRTIERYAPYFRRPLHLIPIPLARGDYPGRAPGGSRDGIRLGFCGYTLPKQGYPFARALYERLVADPACRHVTFSVRHNIHFVSALTLPDIENFLSASERIEHYIGHFTPDKFDSFLESCDVILIPHLRIEYPVQTSGMFIDALCRGKIVVVPEDTWMADQLATYGSGATFASPDFASFYRAVRHVIDNIDAYRAKARRNIDTFAAFHSAANLLDTINIGKPRDETTPAQTREAAYAGRAADRAGTVPGAAPGTAPTEASRAVTGAYGLQTDADRVELLYLRLLEENRRLVDAIYKITHATRHGLGWHTVLDLAWILRNAAFLPKGSVILNAGAGNEPLQFFLAHLGHTVISVDPAPRTPPPQWNVVRIAESPETAGSGGTFADTRDDFRELLRESAGKIVYYRADLHAMTLVEDCSVDAIVSVSVLSRMPAAQARRAFDECFRALRPGGHSLVTVGASLDTDRLHQESKTWCFSENTLRSIFGLPGDAPSNFAQAAAIMDEIKQPGNELHRRLAAFYSSSGANGMPWGVWDPKYLPAGIARKK
ncbi:MAG: methyltransferase domain-containing protein [Chitinivibrionales bacterium]|nr:methyltransferase domain-containing protein [Chitinivibrionales bacterium]MBD3394829.1 methyltransferase domain-containing protein [Chitinivibrionales bacterium]